ncbi:flagellin [Rhodovulum sp.]|uniref:flagellin n=1 Tax=Rhodovulum sp. TaxID=34009 RepID=UPI0017B0F673|nr:flagellin [Rhodovulum sp.]HDR28241.1 flagellin [Rhodovulum sp.]
MSSILTNTGAMTALQTLKSINANMAKVQDEISTGKSISSAKDNAAVWAISKVMESDVKGFEAISGNLALGESTVAVARNATESVTELLTEIKDKITNAQEGNMDRDKLQTDIKQLSDQIKSVIASAQFNGLNLLDGSNAGNVQVLSSLNRTSSNVNAASIDVATQNLTSDGFTASTKTVLYSDGTNAQGAIDDTNTGTAAAALAATGDEGVYSASVNGKTFSLKYTSEDISALASGNNNPTSADDVNAYIASKLGEQVNAAFGDIFTFSGDGTDGVQVTLADATAGTAFEPYRIELGTGNAGALIALDSLNVGSTASDTERKAALTEIENMIQSAIDASASFGSVEKRIGIQADFVSKLTDSLKTGIGTLTDADMEATSARLQALQVQQQLGTQSLSIANQAPQNLLSLFR